LFAQRKKKERKQKCVLPSLWYRFPNIFQNDVWYIIFFRPAGAASKFISCSMHKRIPSFTRWLTTRTHFIRSIGSLEDHSMQLSLINQKKDRTFMPRKTESVLQIWGSPIFSSTVAVASLGPAPAQDQVFSPLVPVHPVPDHLDLDHPKWWKTVA
jgi:hypothetical protein